jgi:hypothetical protein
MPTEWLLRALKGAFVRSFKLTLKVKINGRDTLVFAGPPLAALMILLLFPLAGYAYTLVLRNGRRIEIPDRFVVSQSWLIYETAPGMSVSMQIATIDIDETELANGESPGSFFTHQAETTQPVESSSRLRRSQGSAKNVTNRELEKFQQERLKNDEIYDRDHKRRGLPSRDELRRMEWDSEQKMKQLASEVEAERARTQALQAQLDMLAIRQLAVPYYQGPQGYYDGSPNGYYDGLYSWPGAIVLDSGFGFGEFGRRFNRGFGFGQFDRGFNLNFGLGQFDRDRGFFRYGNRFRTIRPPRGLFPGGFFADRSGTQRIRHSYGVIGTRGIRTRR